MAKTGRLAVLIALGLTPACADPEPPTSAPGHALHRLNRAEYDRTVRDLLGTTTQAAAEFPADDQGHGFDNLADNLTLSPVQLELYAAAAHTLVQQLVGAPPVARVDGRDLAGPDGAAYHERGWRLAEGHVDVPFEAKAPGTYRFTVAARSLGAAEARGAMGARPIVAMALDGAALARAEISAERTRLEASAMVSTTEGRRRLSLAVTSPETQASELRSALIEWVLIEGPLESAARGPQFDRVFLCRPQAGEPVVGRERSERTRPFFGSQIAECARRIFEPLIRRAYRRPPRAGEVAAHVALATAAWDEGERFEDAIGVGLEAILTSPHFLFRIEPTAPRAGVPLDDLGIASRLSYFLWSSAPDERLLSRAESGGLVEESQLVEEARRMLADPKADALVESFAGQWLRIRAVEATAPSSTVYPELDDALKEAMSGEMTHFFRALLAEARPVEDLLRADFTFVNARLARHYGFAMPDDSSAGFRRVELPADSPRRGLLGKAAFALVTSSPARTSPVKRGKWILSELLCSAPAPPPPMAAGAAAPDGDAISASERQRLEAHRKDPACAGCHAAMDPIGLGLENFDGIGRWRMEDGGQAIDASGELFGERFSGPRELSEIIARRRELRRCIAEKLFIYALGRGPTAADAPEIDRIVDRVGAAGGSFSAAAIAVVTSSPFRERKVSP